MNKKMAILLAVCLFSVGFVGLVPMGTAQPYAGTVLLGDNQNPVNYKNYFDLYEDVHYYVTATDAGVEMQDADLDIQIVRPSGAPIYNDQITTDQFGAAEGSWGGTGEPALYTLYVNYTGENIATTTFRVYNPFPKNATVVTYANTYRDQGGTQTIYFNSDDRIYFSIYLEDQFGNPFTDNEWPEDRVHTDAEHNGEIRSEGRWDHLPGNDPYIDEYYDPSENDQFPNLEERYGTYLLNITNENGVSIGYTTFYVIDVEVGITPEKSKYVQGEQITLFVETSIKDTIDVRVLDPEQNILSDANWTNQALISGRWTKDYTLGANIPDGQYRIEVIKDGNIMKTHYFNVEKYRLKTYLDTDAYLPGETIKVYYSITHNKDGSGVTNAVLEWIFRYRDEKDNDWVIMKDAKQQPGSHGMFTIPIPKTADHDYSAYLWVWANDTQDHSSDTYDSIKIGTIDASVSVSGMKFVAGDFIACNIEAHVNGANLRHGTVTFNVSKDGNEISAYTKNNLKTDLEGDLNYIFMLQSNAEVGFYLISVNVSKEGTNEYAHAFTSFEVVSQRDMYIKISFDNKYKDSGGLPLYYSGDKVTASYTVFRGDEVLSNLNCEYQASFDNNIISVGTTSSGKFSFDIPSDLKGYIYVWLECTDSKGTKVSTTGYIIVEGTGLIMTPSSNHFKPGDTIKVEYKVVGTVDPNAKYYYEIRTYSSSGNIVRKDVLAPGGGSFKFTVPKENPPDVYHINGFMTDQNGVIIAQTFVRIDKLTGYFLTFSLDKDTYRPGETATLKYKVTSLDGMDVPKEFRLTYSFSGGPEHEVDVTKPEGSLKLKVPDDAADGEGYFSISSDIAPTARQEANIRESPNPLAGNIGDLSLMDILLLIFVIIALIFGLGGYIMGKKAVSEAKLPPWKKESSLPQPEKFKEPEETPEPLPEPMSEPKPPQEPPEDTGAEPPYRI